jgi:hypothetical protein
LLRLSQDPTFMRHTQAAPTFQAGEHDARELQVVMYTATVLLRYGDEAGGRGTWLEQVQRSRAGSSKAITGPPGSWIIPRHGRCGWLQFQSCVYYSRAQSDGVRADASQTRAARQDPCVIISQGAHCALSKIGIGRSIPVGL